MAIGKNQTRANFEAKKMLCKRGALAMLAAIRKRGDIPGEHGRRAIAERRATAKRTANLPRVGSANLEGI